MAVFVLYQGQRFEVDPDFGDADAVQEHLQELLMGHRFIKAAWVDGRASELPAAWISHDDDGDRHRSMPAETRQTAAMYTVYPSDADHGVLYRAFLPILLANGTRLRVLVHDGLELAVLQEP